MGRKAINGHKGYTGRVFVDSQEFCVEQWQGTHTVEFEDTTNTCSGGGTDQEPGAETFEGSLSGTLDITDNPYNDPPNLDPGNTVGLKLFLHSSADAGGDGPFFQFSANIISSEWTVPAKGKVGFVINFKSKGAITKPTGEVSSGA